ncbi:MAG: hypothetical protein KBA86_00100 [Bacteroidales bacterium]|nr:hypothetical protein [Bacteroidales bacterium]
MNLKFFNIVILIFISFFTYSQGPIAIGEWRTHYNYTESKDIAILNDIVYVASMNSLFYMNLEDKTLHRLGVLEGLNDIGIQTIEVSKNTNTLIICYLNSNIDLYNNGNIYNIPYIANKQISGDKSIYNIHCEGDYAYLACGFGIVILDLKNRLIKDTWFFQVNGQTFAVNDVCINNDTIFTATTQGIYINDLHNVAIAQFSSWRKITESPIGTKNYSFIESFEQNVYTVTDASILQIDTLFNEDSSSFTLDTTVLKTIDLVYVFQNGKWDLDSLFGFEEIRNINSVNNRLVITRGWGANAYKYSNATLSMDNSCASFFPANAICNQWGYICIADKNKGLICQTSDGSMAYSLPGPATDAVWSINISQSVLASVPGAYSDWVPLWMPINISLFENEKWNNLLYDDLFFSSQQAHDALDIIINPNNTKEMFVASYISGLLHIKDGKVINIYNDVNAPMEKYGNRVQINALSFDNNFNLWMLHSQSTNPLLVRMNDGTWQSFNIYYTSGEIVGNMLIDSRGWIWMTGNRETSLLIFNPAGTPLNTADDQLVKLNTSLSEAEGSFDYIYSLAEDKDGKIWIGTNKGIKVYYSPSQLLNNPGILPYAPRVQMDSLTELLLNYEIIKCIKVDGGNRKWIGTDNAGVFLLSEDGETELLHFTTDNSPLLSNCITDIDIDGRTGEIFIATDKGLISFRYTATDGEDDYEEIKIFPNPVRENFSGYISITGLKENSEVKFTDAFGSLVYRTKSMGGTATWNGFRFDGTKASSGVYFVFVSDITGKEKKAGKILFIK